MKQKHSSKDIILFLHKCYLIKQSFANKFILTKMVLSILLPPTGQNNIKLLPFGGCLAHLEEKNIALNILNHIEGSLTIESFDWKLLNGTWSKKW